MKPKIASILLSLAVLVSLAACGSDPAENASDSGCDPVESVSLSGGDSSAEPSTPAQGQTAGADAYSFVINGTEIVIGQNMPDVLAFLGEPQSYFEAESCAFEGLDKTYTYSGFVITTYPDGEQDLINSICLTDDSTTTQEGIYIGCTADQVQTIYGDAENEYAGALSYTKGDTMLNFILEADVVISIEYLSAIS